MNSDMHGSLRLAHVSHGQGEGFWHPFYFDIRLSGSGLNKNNKNKIRGVRWTIPSLH